MVNRIPLLFGVIVVVVLGWGYSVTVDGAFFEAALDGADRLFRPGPMIAFIIMIPIALVSGLMPGGGLPFLVVVLSFATELDPFIALPVVIGYMAANDLTDRPSSPARIPARARARRRSGG